MAQLMGPHCHPRRVFGSLQQGCKGTLRNVQCANCLDSVRSAQDEMNFPQQLTTGEWCVRVRHSVASTEDLVTAVVFLEHAMSEETAVALEQRDITWNNIAGLGRIYHKRIARPNRGQHAPTSNLDAKGPRKPQGLGRQFAFNRMCQRALRCGHETFLLPNRQLLWVPVFKQRKAVVTNICSQRNEGFSYGFFCSARVF